MEARVEYPADYETIGIPESEFIHYAYSNLRAEAADKVVDEDKGGKERV